MPYRKIKFGNFRIVILAAVAVMLCRSISIAQEPIDSATESLKKIFADMPSESVSSTDLSEIRSLIERGADVNVASEDGITVLHVASLQGQREIVELLLEAGAKVNADDGDGSTALMLASENGHPEIIILLLEAGAKVNAENDNKATALFLALWKGPQKLPGCGSMPVQRRM